VCLLIAMFQLAKDAPLIIAANRDERLDRPAVPMTVLREQGPRILGGRDLLAGGTWLAVNEHGVVAGLTNQPSAYGRDPTKRSRGELPLAFAAHRSAAEAVDEVVPGLDPARYNPCWMLVGDRETLFSIGLAGGGKPELEQLGPGLHVLENAPLRSGSAKAAWVRELIGGLLAESAAAGELPGGGDLDAQRAVAVLETVLGDHRPAVTEPRTDDTGRIWPPALSAACVHADGYGTRSAMTVSVPATGLPSVRVAAGPPCETPLHDVTSAWAEPPAETAG
jgi:uncharacterized protein with NRDE domain